MSDPFETSTTSSAAAAIEAPDDFEAAPAPAPAPARGPRSSSSSTISALVRVCRPKQWCKNALIFLPVFLGHQARDYGKLWGALLAAVAFSWAASSVYVVNDWVDAEDDRQHPIKRD